MKRKKVDKNYRTIKAYTAANIATIHIDTEAT